jgi:hypothetical protein
MIDSFKFGKIVVDGKTYTSDLIIFPEKIKENWVRIKGHKLFPNDLKEVVEHKPDLLIIGKGAYGVMKIPDETKEFLKSKDIDFVSFKTKKACEKYNELSIEKDVVFAMHLTC